MFEELKDGCVVVIGGTGGLGAAICRKFASIGSPVVFSYRSGKEKAIALRDELAAHGVGARAVEIDLRNAETVRPAFAGAEDQFGRIHTVVFASGPIVEFRAIADMTQSEWEKVIATDVFGFFNIASVALPYLRKTRGSIVALSTSGTKRYPSLDIMSAGPKAAVEMMVKGIAREEGRNGVRANCVLVGQINAGQGLTIQEGPKGKRLAERIMQATPLRRFGEGDDIAHAALFLASDMASFVTGECLCVDGGVHL